MTLLVMLSGVLTVGPLDGSLEECGVASDLGVWGQRRYGRGVSDGFR